jgi:hypothetical protein
LRLEVSEQEFQARSAVFDQRAQRHDLSTAGMKHVSFDALIGRDREPGEVVLSCPDSLDRALPAHRRTVVE